MSQGGHVYILGSVTGTLYIGVTSDLYLRMQQHRSGSLSGFAHEHGCTRLLYAEPFALFLQAIVREKQLKGWTRAKKLALIQKLNPTCRDLAEHWGWHRIGPAQRMDEQ